MRMSPRSRIADGEVAWLDGSAVSRRGLLQKAGTAAMGMSAMAMLAACGDDGASTTGRGAGTTAPPKPTGTVTFLGFEGYDDKKAAASVLNQGVKLDAQYIGSSSEILTKLRGGGIGSIDVVTPGAGHIKRLAQAGLLMPMDYGRMPNTGAYFPEFAEVEFARVDDEVYAAPIVWGDVPLVYRSDRFKELPESWLDLRDPKYKGQLVTIDDFSMLYVLSGVIFGPGPDQTRLTPAQLDEVAGVMKEIKKNIVTIVSGYGDAADVIARGDALALVQGWRFVEVLLNEKKVAAASHVPSEGTLTWADSYAIAADAPNPDAAYAFIDTMLSAKSNAMLGSALGSGVTNGEAVARLTPDEQKLYPYDDIDGYFAAQQGFIPLPPVEPEGDLATLDDWTEAWEGVKAS